MRRRRSGIEGSITDGFYTEILAHRRVCVIAEQQAAELLTGGIDRHKQAIRLEEKVFHTVYTLRADCLPASWKSLPLCGIVWKILDGQYSIRSEYRN